MPRYSHFLLRDVLEAAVPLRIVISCTLRRCFALALFLGLLFVLGRTADAEPAILPEPTLPPNGNPLCTSNVVQCLDIDDFAGHFWGHLQVLPATQQRGTAAVFPFGITLGIFGRLVGSISTQYAFWSAGDGQHQQLGPLRLSLTGRLLPVFPLGSSGGSSETNSSGETYYVPPRGFRLGVSYEHELRVNIFEGANALGLLTDLAMFRIIGSKAFGPFELTASLGALYDWQGRFATAEIAAQFGLHLPFFKALKVYVEALGRGFPAYRKQDARLPALDPVDPIHRQGVFGGGLSFQPHARVDLSVSVQAGVGGLAPWAVSVRFLTFSLGKTYQGRAATPIGQMAVDATAAFVEWAAERVRAIDPYLKNNCVLYDDNHRPMAKLGELSPDRQACIYQGLRVPIGPHFWRDRGHTRVCHDEKLRDCFLTRPDRYAAWEPVHPMLVHNDCFVYLNGQLWMRAGTPTPDKQGCERDGQVIPVGQTLKPTPTHPGFYCYDEPDKARRQTEKLWCLERPERPQTDGQYVGRRFAGGIDRAQESLTKTGDRVRQVIDEGDQGVPLHATTPVKEAEAQGRRVIEAAKNVTTDDAKRAFDGTISAARKWWDKPLREQLGDVADAAGETMASPSTWVGAGAVLGRGGRALSAGADALGDAAGLGKEAKKVGKAAKKVEQRVAEHTIPAVGSTPELSSRAARREAMRQAGIPTTQQPRAQIRTSAGMQYEYDVTGKGGKKMTGIVTDQTTDRVPGHGPHWEAGIAKGKHEHDPLGRLRVRNGKSKVEYRD